MSSTQRFLEDIWGALGGTDDLLRNVSETGTGSFASVFAVTDFAAASTASAALALADLVRELGGPMPDVHVDRRLASFWFSKSIRPIGWNLPPQWDSVAGDYKGRDGWIRLHTNAPHHRAAALKVLGVAEDRALVAEAVKRWSVQDLEDAVVAANGCAAALRSLDTWKAHAQGRAVATEPLLHLAATTTQARRTTWDARPDRPLAGLRVLDLTRVLAGPVGTRFLAGYGADVLRIDPPGWDEPAVLPEVTLGKRRARLDLRAETDRVTFERLLGEADVLVHGYRSDALAGLGYDDARIDALAPGLVNVALDAYGWTGPWRTRRGFDSLVQLSSGLAHAGMVAAGAEKPIPLPVQALDYGTGCIVAAAVLRGLTLRLRTGQGVQFRASLARTAACLAAVPHGGEAPLQPEADADLSDAMEQTAWGASQRLKAPVRVGTLEMRWDIPAGELGDATAFFATKS